ncbi:MAG: UvrD-helicase domain-containing protein [Gammaproteobacteria bacterium]
MSGLNPQQREAVKHIDTPLLVLAGAGSGKTRVITTKILHLIENCALEPRKIAAVTFTNKAAREMKMRVKKMSGDTNIKGLRISTFHTLGLQIIQQEYQRLGYRKGFSIFDYQDSLNLIIELTRKTHGDFKDFAAPILSKISAWKNACTSPEQAISQAFDAETVLASEIYKQYNRHLHTYNAVDFDDLIMLPVQVLREYPECLAGWQERIRYLLVDEYQDTNGSQYELVKLIAGDRGKLTVVGDDDQSIYAWRGAQPENLKQLQVDFPDLKVIKLEQNYRSMRRILGAANQLISGNPHVFEKKLWSDLGNGDRLRVMQAKNEEDEADKVITDLAHHKFTHRTRLHDYAILYRGNHQSRIFERILRERNIAYYLSGGMSFFDYSEIKDIMAYLKVLVNPEDTNALLRIINVPRRALGPSSVEKLANFANEKDISLFSAMFETEHASELNSRASSKFSTFSNWLSRMAESAESEKPNEILKQLLADISYDDWLDQTSKDPVAADRRRANVMELVEWITRLHTKDKDAKLEDIIRNLTLLDIINSQENDENNDQVSLMTLHAAKGLEFPHVYLVGMEEGLLPHRNSIEMETIEEERRLAYVGITRAQKTMTFSLASKRQRYGEKIDCEPSRFLEELPRDDLHFIGEDKFDPTDKKEGRATIAGLKDLLGGKAVNE